MFTKRKISTLKIINAKSHQEDAVKHVLFFFLTANQSFSIGHPTSFCIVFQLISKTEDATAMTIRIVPPWILNLDTNESFWMYMPHFFQLSPFTVDPKPISLYRSHGPRSDPTWVSRPNRRPPRLTSCRECFFVRAETEKTLFGNTWRNKLTDST